jgi:hypothetical protein
MKVCLRSFQMIATWATSENWEKRKKEACVRKRKKERSLCEKKEERKKQTRVRRVWVFFFFLLRLCLFLLLPASFAPFPESLRFEIFVLCYRWITYASLACCRRKNKTLWRYLLCLIHQNPNEMSRMNATVTLHVSAFFLLNDMLLDLQSLYLYCILITQFLFLRLQFRFLRLQVWRSSQFLWRCV